MYSRDDLSTLPGCIQVALATTLSGCIQVASASLLNTSHTKPQGLIPKLKLEKYYHVNLISAIQ